MMSNINTNQLNNVRGKLISYEHKRDQLKGLDDLNAGLDILSEYLEDIDSAECNVTAKNLFITYKRNSIEWIKRMLKYCYGDESELSTLTYCREVMETFEDTNKLIDPRIEFDNLKQSISERFVECRLGINNIFCNLTSKEKELLIKLLGK
jgi:hypothetical protein